MEYQPLQQEIDELEEQLRLKKQALRAQSGSDKSKLFVAASILIAGIMISGAVVYTRKDASQISASSKTIAQQRVEETPEVTGIVNVSGDDDAFLGQENAPVTIIEFSDFQCPFCRKFWQETLPEIKKAYIDTGKARFVYRDFPLSFHAGATPAAEGAECARAQGKFWELHDTIFGEQEKLGQGTISFTADDVKKWAAKIGLNTKKFNQCLDARDYRQEVEKDIADGSAAGVNGTPAIFINGRLVVGAQPFAAFQAIIDEELRNQ